MTSLSDVTESLDYVINIDSTPFINALSAGEDVSALDEVSYACSRKFSTLLLHATVISLFSLIDEIEVNELLNAESIHGLLMTVPKNFRS